MDKLKALLKKLGASSEDIADIETEIDEAKESEIAGLKKKNAELIAKQKAKETGDGGKVAELEAKVDELTEQNATLKRDTDKAVKKLTSERDDAQTALTSERSAVSRLVLENGLTEELTKAGIKKELLPAARAYLRERGALSVESEGDIRKAVAIIKDKAGDRKVSIDAYVKEFASSDEGKAFIPAEANQGSGSGGPAGQTAKKPWKDMTLKERTEIHLKDPALAKQLAGAV